MRKYYKNPKVNARQSKSERRDKYQSARRVGWSVSASRKMRDYPYEFRCTPQACRDKHRW